MTRSPAEVMVDEWATLECDRALYVDRGRNVILCDRLPGGRITLVVKNPRATHEAE